MIYILLIVACTLTVVSFFLNKRDIIAPSFIFCATFTFAICWATAYAEKWDLVLHNNTFMVIAGGMAEFVMVCSLIQWWMRKRRGTRRIKTCRKLNYIYIKPWKKIVVIMAQLVTLGSLALFYVRVMSANLFNVASAITAYRSASLLADPTLERIPGWIGLMLVVIMALGYWFVFVMVNNIMVRKRVEVLDAIVVLLSMVTSMSLGSRGDALFMVLSTVATVFLLNNKKRGFYRGISFKTLFVVILAAVLILFTFRWTAELFGRDSNFTIADYIAIYCGAEIKNLDLFLQEAHATPRIWGGQTFINFILGYGGHFGLDIARHGLDMPFRMVNGYNLGNVYTTFYPYIYDFGYAGVPVMVGLMAMITQWVYERAKRSELIGRPPFSIVLYGYIFGSVFFSFFSNKFYEYLASGNFIKTLAVWFLCNLFFCKMRFKIKR